MKCWHCKAEFDRTHALRVAENKFTLDWEDWAGWRFSGRFLIAPGRAGRITPRRLLGMLWEERQRELSRARRNNGTPGIHHRSIVAFPQRLPARERFDGLA
jgi:hypothetical protein